MGAPQARLHELAVGLIKRGHEVTVLTAMPNYPVGKIFPGYGGLIRREVIDGVQVIRTAIYPTQTAKLFPRLINYFSFVISSLSIGGWYLKQADYLLTESPPLFLGIAGYFLSHWKRARWIFNVSDLWPESAVRLGIIHDGLALRISEALEAFCYRKAWGITGQSKSTIQNIQQRFPGVRTHHFSNGVDTQLFQPEQPSVEARKPIAGWEDSIIAIYAGLHGHAQGLDQVLEAAYELQNRTELQFIFLGDGPEKGLLIEQARRLNLRNVHFLDPVPRDHMPKVLAAADICIIPLKAYIPGAVPSKIYEAMATAKPIVLVAESEPADIVLSHQAGLAVKPADISNLSAAILKLVEHPELRDVIGKAGRKAAENHFDRSKIIDKFVEFISN